MQLPARRAALVLLGVASLATPGATASAATKPKPTAASSLRALERQSASLPKASATRAKRASLARLARRARRVARGAPCVAVADLARFRRSLRTARVPAGRRARPAARRLLALGPASVVASRLLLADARTRRCGGGVATTPATRSTTTTVTRSDAEGMRVRVQLPALRFVAESGGGRAWTRLALPDTDVPGRPGTPGIPVAASTFAVPDGATVTVTPGRTTSYALDGVEVYPAQPESVDQARPAPDFAKAPFASKPFAFDAKAYAKAGKVPRAAASGGVLGSARDLVIGNLQVPAARYDPRSDRLEVLTSVVVDIAFKGGARAFDPELASPWESAQRRLAATLLNADIVRSDLVWAPRRCGEEMLVVTHPSTRAAAQTFVTARRAAGIRTTLVEVGTAPGQVGATATAIQASIRDRLLDRRCIRPSYITIVGDDELVPTHPGINGIPSDLPYSLRDGADELPDVAVGRILGNDENELTVAVNKIVGYETTPPSGAFLRRATIAAQFQDDDGDGRENRTFIQFAETVRTGLTARGVTVDRIYGEEPGSSVPAQFNDGTPLPTALLAPFAWNGSGADVSSAWNAGRFLMVHRDHGWSDGWGTPLYTTGDVNALTNGADLPVVMSINCSSAAYDYDEDSFAQASLVKPGGGSVGVFGDTRDSPSWHNTQIALGFVDALLPSVLPAEGPAAKQRTGGALTHGKLRLAGLAPPGGDGNTRNELYLWHYFGDPSMQMWGGDRPRVFDVGEFRAVYERLSPVPRPGDPPPYVVRVTLPPGLAGQAVSLLQGDEVVGKAIAGEGAVTIPADLGDAAVRPGDLRVALEADGAVPVAVGVDGVPAPAPPPPPPPAEPEPEPQATALQQSCPGRVPYGNSATITVSGTLQGGPANARVDVTFRAPDGRNAAGAPTPGRTIVVPATTDAKGGWTASVTTSDKGEIGPWTVSSAHAATKGYKASSAGPCITTVFDNS